MAQSTLRSVSVVAAGCYALSAIVAPAFVTPGVPQATSAAAVGAGASVSKRFLAAESQGQAGTTTRSTSVLFGSLGAAAVGVALRALVGGERRTRSSTSIVACRSREDEQAEDLGALARQALGSAATAALVVGSLADSAAAYPIFAQQNYDNPRAPTGKIACANCHLQGKYIDVRMPHEVLPDTIFKATIEIPAKYEKRRQPIASGEKGPMNVGAIAVMPEGWKLAPKKRLPKPLKKEMKGLAWAQYSKKRPNIVVAGPVPGARYQTMTLPILAPDPNADKDINFDKYTFYYGGNRGRGQVYPEGNLSNNNQFTANAAGKIASIDGLKITVEKEDGTTAVTECGAGADIVVSVGEVVKAGDPLTTNPNVGGFGQEEKEMVLQDMNRVYAYCALATSIFLSQLAFVLKKKQFEKVQLAEGF